MNEFLTAEGLAPEDGAFGDHALTLDYLHNVRNWWTHYHFEDIGRLYRSDVGFRPQVGFTGWVAGGARVWWPEEGAFFNRIGLGGDLDRTVTRDGDLIEEEIESWLNLQGPRESYAGFGFGRRNRAFEGVEYPQWFGSAWFEVQVNGSWNVGLSVDQTDWIDFEHARAADRFTLRPRFRLNYGRHLLVQFSHLYRTLEVDGGRLFRFHVPEATVVHQFNGRAFARVILQFTDIERDPSLYEDEVDAETRNLLGQLLFSYKLNSATALYLGYTDVHQGTDEFDLIRTDRTFFLKISYAWMG
jgi:hypothetical protein